MSGEKRDYFIFLPTYIKNTEKYPLFIVLHGGLGNAIRISKVSKINTFAERKNFIAVYPEGTPVGVFKNMRTWNGGYCCGSASDKNKDDVLFISRIIDKIKSRYPVDPERVFVIGFSNGGMLAYRVACEIPDKIKGIACISGALVYRRCDVKKAKNVSILHIHGTADKNIPISGGYGKGLSGIFFPSLKETITKFVKVRNCKRYKEKSLRTVSVIYRCKNGSVIKVILLKGWGHKWPYMRDFFATEEIVDFYLR